MNFSVAKCTVSSKGGAILKLVHKENKSLQTPFGMKTSTTQQTFYMKVDAPVALNTVGELDPATFNVVERPYTITDPASDMNGQEVMLKWLHLK